MVVVHLNRELEKRRGERTWAAMAAEIGCQCGHLSDVLHGKKSPGPKVCDYLGVIRKVVYVRKDVVS